jgi:hypothetical protein
VLKALDQLRALPTVLAQPVWLRVESFA